MAKLKQTIGDASIEVDGPEDAIKHAVNLFGRNLIERELREVEAQLSPLLIRRRSLKKLLIDLKNGS